MYDYLVLLYRLTLPFLDIRKISKAFLQYISFLQDYYKYKKFDDSEKINIRNLFPIVNEKSEFQPFDSHYFYQDIWAIKRIQEYSPMKHVDVGSSINFIGILTVITHVLYVDIRKLDVKLKNYEFQKGNILEMPFNNNSIESLSCLHVAEHIGLGRYGDKLDPHGTLKACKELQRILKPGGNLFFSLPVGKDRVCFNAHRIHRASQIVEYFDVLKLVSLNGVDDNRRYYENVDIDFFDNNKYACGFFHFIK